MIYELTSNGGRGGQILRVETRWEDGRKKQGGKERIEKERGETLEKRKREKERIKKKSTKICQV